MSAFSFWKPAELDQLKRMVAAGKSAGQIAARLGRSRGSVAGKLHRAKGKGKAAGNGAEAARAVQ